MLYRCIITKLINTMDEAKIVEMVKKAVSEWFASQKDQTDGYQYEKSFVDCWRITGNKVLQESIGEIPVSKNKKKNFKAV